MTKNIVPEKPFILLCDVAAREKTTTQIVRQVAEKLGVGFVIGSRGAMACYRDDLLTLLSGLDEALAIKRGVADDGGKIRTGSLGDRQTCKACGVFLVEPRELSGKLLREMAEATGVSLPDMASNLRHMMTDGGGVCRQCASRERRNQSKATKRSDDQ
jgi:hypothetical protein